MDIRDLHQHRLSFSKINSSNFHYLFDSKQEIAKKFGAVCTPDFFGYNKDLKLQYRGRFRELRELTPVKSGESDLKSAMIKTDLELYNGAFNRFNKNFDIKIIIEFLKKNQFKIPLIDTEQVHLEYNEFMKLLHDVRSMNLSYYQKDKKETFEKKLYFKKLENNYSKKNDGKFKLSSNFYIISGWKEHISQQKPMKPGKAKNKLSDFLAN